MFADNTLTPKEAVRLCALGSVALAPQHYSLLAGSVRQFCGRIMGPSLDLMGLSIELLRYEGLIEPVEGGQGMEDDALMAITDAGQRELRSLLTARLRPSSDLSKLIIALKFRFLSLLSVTDQRVQVDMLLDMTESELARLESLREDVGTASLHDWLDLDISLLHQRLDWLEAFAAKLGA